MIAIDKIRAILGKDRIDSKDTRFSRFQGDFVLSQGTITSDNLHLLATDLEVSAEGALALSGKMEFHARATLSEELTAKVRASPVSSFFFREGNRAVIPLVIQGTAFHPAVALDTDYLAEKIREAPKKKVEEEIKDAVKGLFDKLLKKDGE